MPEPLKYTLFNADLIHTMAAAFQSADPAFDAPGFLARVFDDHWDALELKARMRQITLALRATLPDDYRAALAIMRQAAPATPGFIALSFCDYVEQYGLDDWDASIPALEQFTLLCSAEFAVRPFILRDPARMMAQMLAWSCHDHPGVRRLASEGCRPRLPWAMSLPNLQADPAPILPILDQLKLDESDDVRRSVANNLNDISKDNPQVTLGVVRRWQHDHDSPAMRQLISHALRTLIKQGDPGALELLGYATSAAFRVHDLTVAPAVIPMGGEVTIAFEVESLSDTPQALMIDYVIHLVRARGQHTQKVFKLTKRTLTPGETIRLRQRHSFEAVTTRRYYPGEHAVEIQINGVRSERRAFVIEEIAGG
jgi:3-methyladenine DNA glycosylase AlkC